MPAVTFDTLKFVETLKASGFDDAQAKGMASAIREVQDTHIDDLATKRDVEDLKKERESLATKGDIKDLDVKLVGQIAEIKRDIKELELRMVIKTGGMILAGIGLLFGLMRVWPLPMQYVPPPHSQEAPAYQSPAQPPR